MLSNGVFYLPMHAFVVDALVEQQVEMYLTLTSFSGKQISVQHKVLIRC